MINRVYHDKYGFGTCLGERCGYQHLIMFDNPHEDLHNGGFTGQFNNNRCRWCLLDELSEYESKEDESKKEEATHAEFGATLLVNATFNQLGLSISNKVVILTGKELAEFLDIITSHFILHKG